VGIQFHLLFFLNHQIQKCNQILQFLVLNNIKDVPKEINKSTKKGDSVLIKGSRCWQLEKIIELIH